MDRIVINLTKKQIELLKPLYNLVKSAADNKSPGILHAQVFADHMEVGFLCNYIARQIVSMQGGDPDNPNSRVKSAYDKPKEQEER